MQVPDRQASVLIDYYNTQAFTSCAGDRNPARHLFHFHDPDIPIGSLLLTQEYVPLSHIVIDGRRITPHATASKVSSLNPSASAIVKVKHGAIIHCGEVLSAFLHRQLERPPTIFVQMIYMIPAADGTSPLKGDPWAQ